MSRRGRALVAAFVAMVATFIVAACTGGVVYDTYRHTQLSGWDKGDTLFYDITPLRQSGRYRQEIGLRVNESFPFTGLTLVVDKVVEPGHRIMIDTVNCRLADSKGNTLVQGVSYYQYDFIVSEDNLQEGDSLHVGIRHIMKREILPGIADVGLRLTRVQ